MAIPRARRRVPTSRGGSVLWGFVALFVLAGLIALVLSITDWFGGDSEPPTEQFGISATEAVENPDEYQDETVTISGEVNRVLGPFVYTIGGEDFADGHELLIFGPPPTVTDTGTPEPESVVRSDDIVQVSGNLRQADISQIEDEMEVQIDAEIPQELQDQPALVAQGSVVTARRAATAGTVAEVDELLEDPDEYTGETVTVSGSVTGSFGQAAVELNDELLVIDTTGSLTQQALDEAEQLQASGEVAIFDQETIQTETDLDPADLDLERFQGQPVIIADAIQLLPEQDEQAGTG